MRGKDKEILTRDLLVRQYEKYYRMAYSYVRSESDAQDIVQEVAKKDKRTYKRQKRVRSL